MDRDDAAEFLEGSLNAVHLSLVNILEEPYTLAFIPLDELLIDATRRDVVFCSLWTMHLMSSLPVISSE